MTIKKIEIKNSNYYDDKFLKFGNSIKSVGWSNSKDQFLRFEYLFKGINFTNKKILDVGCGFGDLVEFLRLKVGNNFSYLGIDISKNMIKQAKKNHFGDHINFKNVNLNSLSNLDIDISVLSGALTYNHSSQTNLANYMIKKMYDISKDSASLNFLSSYSDYQLKKNIHYQPEKIFKYSKKISKKVNIFHDYDLFEFTIQLFK